MIQLILSLIGFVLSNWWVWAPLGLLLIYFAWQNNRRNKWILNTDYQVLEIISPGNFDESDIAAEKLLESLHGMLRPKTELIKEGALQEHISFEIVNIDQRIHLYIWMPKHLHHFIVSQLNAAYPELQIQIVKNDYTRQHLTQSIFHSVELTLKTNEALPLQTYTSFEIDPLSSLVAELSKLNVSQEQMWMHVLAKPVDKSWQKRGKKHVEQIKTGKATNMNNVAAGAGKYLWQFLKAFFQPPEATTDNVVDIGDKARTQIQAIENKISKPGYEVKIRIAYIGHDRPTARSRIQSLLGAFKQYEHQHQNGFKISSSSFDHDKQREFSARFFKGKGFVLNAEELASLWHIPQMSTRVRPQTKPSPDLLPNLNNSREEEISLIGATHIGEEDIQFGILRQDRANGVYVTGQSGTGKSGLLRLMALSDIYHGQGLAFFDPYGDSAHELLRYIPSNRMDDVAYINLADTAHPVAFNPLSMGRGAGSRSQRAALVMESLSKLFSTWSPRLEYTLHYCLVALIEYQKATPQDILRFLSDQSFRSEVIAHISDPVVRNFWIAEFSSWEDNFKQEVSSIISTSLEPFLSNREVSGMLSLQLEQKLDVQSLIEEGKILIVSLSQSLLQSEYAHVIGSLLMAEIQLAITSRSLTSNDSFYLYIDEFQDIITRSFNTLLEKAAPHGLCLTLANRSIKQLEPSLQKALLTKMGTLITFRTENENALALAPYFKDVTEAEITRLEPRQFVAHLSVKGELREESVLATTLTIPPPTNDLSAVAIEKSRQTYSTAPQLIEEGRKPPRLPQEAPNIAEQAPKPVSSAESKTLPKKRTKSEQSDKQPDQSLEPDQIVHLH